MQKNWYLFEILLIFCVTILCFIYFVPQKYLKENDDFEINPVIMLPIIQKMISQTNEI